MADNKFKLTADSVKRRCVPPQPGEVTAGGKPVQHRFYWDTELRGFGIAVGARSSRFVVQKDVRGQTVRSTIGRYPTWTAEQARKRARELLVQMDQGVNPNEEKRAAVSRGVTLAEAMEMHLTSMRAKDCSPRSLETVEAEIKRHLSDWLQRPLVSIRKSDCVARHRRITEKSGPYTANHALRCFRQCWNTASRCADDDDLPLCPVRAVSFNKESRRREPIEWPSLPAWREAVDAIQNPVRRDLQLFILLTGLRATDAKTVRWAGEDGRRQVDFEAGTIHRPRPKGGKDRAFTVPVAGEVLELLRRRQEQNKVLFPAGDGGWVSRPGTRAAASRTSPR